MIVSSAHSSVSESRELQQEPWTQIAEARFGRVRPSAHTCPSRFGDPMEAIAPHCAIAVARATPRSDPRS